MTAPSHPRCTLARFIPKEMDVESIKADGFNEHGILVVRLDDERINWIEKRIIQTIGKRLYGKSGRNG